MPKSKKSPLTIGLMVNAIRDDSYGNHYFHIVVHPVLIGLNAYEMRRIDTDQAISKDVSSRTIRNCGDASDELYNGLLLAHFQIRCQGDGAIGERRNTYGHDIGYRDVFHIDSRLAGLMAHTLKTLEAKLDKLNKTFDRPATFAQYVARVAHAMDVSRLVFTNNKPAHSSYSDNDHTITDIDGGLYRIDQMEREWINEGVPA